MKKNSEGAYTYTGSTTDGVEALERYFNCEQRIISAAMRGLDAPEWVTPDHLDEVREAVQNFNRAAKHANQLLDAMRQMSNKDLRLLTQNGCATIPQIEHLAKTMENSEDWYRNKYSAVPRTGGKNHAAFVVAKIVLRIFRILGKRITFGQQDGSPTTEYGRAVEYALSAFRVRANWRRAAEAAQDEYDRRKFAAFAVTMRKAIRDNQSKTNSK